MKQVIIQGAPMDEFIKCITTAVVAEIQRHKPAKIETSVRKPIDLLTPAETAEMLKIAPITLHKWKTTGKIPCKYIGRSVRYELAEIQKLLNC